MLLVFLCILFFGVLLYVVQTFLSSGKTHSAVVKMIIEYFS